MIKNGILCISLLVIFGCGRVYRPHISTSSEELISKTENVLYSIAEGFELAGIIPPSSGHDDRISQLDEWGTPFRVESYRGLPTIRSAGPDKSFYSDDDIVAHWKVP
jgi:hypothetical protein